MVEFKNKLDEYIKKEFGIEVEHFYKKDKNGEKVTYEKVFYKARKWTKNGNNLHKIHGWPFQKGPWCNDRLKTGLLDSIKGVHYVGIAADEPERLARLGEKKSPIAELGWAADGHTVHDFDKRFEIEKTLNKPWRWKYLNDN